MAGKASILPKASSLDFATSDQQRDIDKTNRTVSQLESTEPALQSDTTIPRDGQPADAAVGLPPSNGLASGSASNGWLATFPKLASHQQIALLALAREQGALLESQIPTPISNPDSCRTRLLDAYSGRLPPEKLVEQLNPCDAALDAIQRDAVARAIHTPDICVVLGPTGTGKTRVALEIIRHEISRDGKALLVSPDIHAVSNHIERLTQLPEIVFAQGMAGGEASDHSFVAREDALLVQISRKAKANAANADVQLKRYNSLRETADQLAAVRERRAARSEERKRVDLGREALASDVVREADSEPADPPYFIQRIQRVKTAWSKKSAELSAESNDFARAQAEALAKRKEHADRVRQLETLAELRDSKSIFLWLTPSFRAARRMKDLDSQLLHSKNALATSETAVKSLGEKEAAIQAKRADAEAEVALERQRYLDAEIAKRLTLIEGRRASLRKATRRMNFSNTSARLHFATPGSISMRPMFGRVSMRKLCGRPRRCDLRPTGRRTWSETASTLCARRDNQLTSWSADHRASPPIRMFARSAPSTF